MNRRNFFNILGFGILSTKRKVNLKTDDNIIIKEATGFPPIHPNCNCVICSDEVLNIEAVYLRKLEAEFKDEFLKNAVEKTDQEMLCMEKIDV